MITSEWNTSVCLTAKTRNQVIDYEVQQIMGGEDLDEGPPAMIFQPFETSHEDAELNIGPIIVRGPWAKQYNVRVSRDIDSVIWRGRCSVDYADQTW